MATALSLSGPTSRPYAAPRRECGSGHALAWGIDPAAQPGHAAGVDHTKGRMWCGECRVLQTSAAPTGGFLRPTV